MSARPPIGQRAAKGRLVIDTLSAVPIWTVTPALRPWHMHWGATPAEIGAVMPGDDIVADAQFNATRAVTIDAPPDEVWPWIVQVGYGRAGFYTYDLVDNGGVPSADAIVDELQRVEVGDRIPMFHPSHGLAVAYVVDAFEAGAWMVRPPSSRGPSS